MDGILDFVSTMTEAASDKLYGAPSDEKFGSDQAVWACRAIFQSLSTLAKHYVMRLVFVDDASMESVCSWIQIGAESFHSLAIAELKRLRIVKTLRDSNIFLNPYFKASLKVALSNSIEPWQLVSNGMGSCDPTSAMRIPLEKLESFSDDKWEKVLRILVGLGSESGTTQLNSSAAAAAVSFFQSTGLMAPTKDDMGRARLLITGEGYDFMLKDRMTQVRLYVVATINAMPAQHLPACLSFLFTMSYCELGRGYEKRLLAPAQCDLLLRLEEVGVVHEAGDHFFPTRIAVELLFNQSASAAIASSPSSSSQHEQEGEGSQASKLALSIIVETNHQVVAYVSNDLHVEMLKLFIEISVRLPNMAMGKLTRERSKAAYRMGISADQVISFLESHAHPMLLARAAAAAATGDVDAMAVVPTNVSDQLRLWEAETRRIRCEEAVLVDLSEDGPIPSEHFRAAVDYVTALGVCLWHSPCEGAASGAGGNPRRQLIAVTVLGLEQLQSFLDPRSHSHSHLRARS